jgi:uncharacterized damage-inducible protein DinB
MLIAQYTFTRNYLLGAVDAAPDILRSLVVNITPEEADFRPDPDRFTIREVLAHLAAWDPVFLERLQLTKSEDRPTLPVYDPAELLGDLSSKGVEDLLHLFTERRHETAAFLRDIGEDEWDRVAVRQNMGEMTMEAAVVLINTHDTYHYRQIAQWRRMFGEQRRTA